MLSRGVSRCETGAPSFKRLRRRVHCACTREEPLPRRSVRAQHPSDVPMLIGGVSFGGLVASHMVLETTKPGESLAFAACLLVVRERGHRGKKNVTPYT